MTGVNIPLDDEPLPPPGVTGPIGLFKLLAVRGVVELTVLAAARGFIAPCGLCTGVATPLCTWASRGVVGCCPPPPPTPTRMGKAGFDWFITFGVVGVDGVMLPNGLDMGMNVVAAAVLTICGE